MRCERVIWALWRKRKSHDWCTRTLLLELPNMFPQATSVQWGKVCTGYWGWLAHMTLLGSRSSILQQHCSLIKPRPVLKNITCVCGFRAMQSSAYISSICQRSGWLATVKQSAVKAQSSPLCSLKLRYFWIFIHALSVLVLLGVLPLRVLHFVNNDRWLEG